MKKILLSITLGALIFSCSTIEEKKEDLYKDYKPKYSLNLDGKVEEKIVEKVVVKEVIKEVEKIVEVEKKPEITSMSTNEEILSNDKLKTVIFDRNVRQVNKNLKGVWVASVLNLDFPKTKGVESQKKEIDTMMDNIKDWGLNAVFFHVRPSADALYNSEYEPWSIYITGVQNQYPGYDPLEYAIKAAHERGLELHAWINPYRASMNLDRSKLSDKSVVIKHPEWIFEFDGKYYMNPGNPEVVKYVSKAIEEIVEKYDIDGLHLDDYFYPYPSTIGSIGDNIDDEYYAKYGSSYNSKSDWRRDNVNKMIQNLSVSVHKIKPNLSFGVSPFGIWRNSTTDLNGSKTNGLESYDTLYADSIKWMKEGWVDYIAPQIYWNIGFERADYQELLNWWALKAKETNTTLYVGQGTYKVNDWQDKYEVEKQLKLNNLYNEVNGTIFFRYETLLNNPHNILEQIKNNLKK